MNRDNKCRLEGKHMVMIGMREEDIDNLKRIVEFKKTQGIIIINKEDYKEVNKKLEAQEDPITDIIKENSTVRIKAATNKEIKVKIIGANKIEEIVDLEETIDIAKMMIDE